MYLKIKRRLADYAVSVITDAQVDNGGLVKIDGMAAKTIAGVDVSGEAFKGAVLTDAVGDLYAVVAPDVTEDQRYSLVGKTEDDMVVPAGEPTRAYLTHKGLVLTIEKGCVEGTAVVKGDKLAPKAGTNHYEKYVELTHKNALAQVLKVYSYKGKEVIDIVFI